MAFTMTQFQMRLVDVETGAEFKLSESDIEGFECELSGLHTEEPPIGSLLHYRIEHQEYTVKLWLRRTPVVIYPQIQ